MNTFNLHFKWTVSKGVGTYGYNICSLLVDGVKRGQCNGGGYDMQGSSFAQWIEVEFQTELQSLFSNEIIETKANDLPFNHIKTDRFHGVRVYKSKKGVYQIGLNGACGFSSIERIAESIGIILKWNPESDRYKNHNYYTALKIQI